MAYLSMLTAAGHVLMVDPKRQRSLFLDVEGALNAERRLNERRYPYQRYRAARGLLGSGAESVRIAHSVRKHLDQLEDGLFRKIDAAILGLARRPKRAGSKPKHYRWFDGELRRLNVDEFMMVYDLSPDGVVGLLYFRLPGRKRLSPGR